MGEASFKPELFHAIGDPDSAAVRKLLADSPLLARLRFRNITYDEVKADFTARGGTVLPAIWDGARLHGGKDAVLRFLDSLGG